MINQSLPSGKDLFIDVFLQDTNNKEDPIFAKSPDDKEKREIVRGKDVLTIKPSPHSGIATIADRKVLTACINQGIIAASNGDDVSGEIQVNVKDLLKATDFNESNEHEKEFVTQAINRLVGTHIDSTVNHGDTYVESFFKLMSGFSMVSDSKNGRINELKVNLQSWSIKLIESKAQQISNNNTESVLIH